MFELRDAVERELQRVDIPSVTLGGVYRRRDRKRRNRRIRTAVFALVVAAVATGVLIQAFSHTERRPARVHRSWTIEHPPFGDISAADVAAGPTGFVVMVDPAALWYSPDGRVWSQTFTGPRNRFQWFRSITYGHGVFVTVGADHDQPALWYSADGRSWRPARVDDHPPSRGNGTPQSGLLEGVASTAQGFVTWGEYRGAGTRVWTSADGGTWNPIPDESVFDGPGRPYIQWIAQGPSGLLAIGQTSLHPEHHALVWTSVDGQTWTRHTPIVHCFHSWCLENDNWRNLDPTFIAGRYESYAVHLASTDGITWTETSRPRGEGLAGALPHVVAPDGNGGFVTVRGEDSHGELTSVWTSADGLHWKRVPDPGGVLGSTSFTPPAVAVNDRGIVVIQGTPMEYGIGLHPLVGVWHP